MPRVGKEEDYWTFIKILSTVQERLEDDLVRTMIQNSIKNLPLIDGEPSI